MEGKEREGYRGRRRRGRRRRRAASPIVNGYSRFTGHNVGQLAQFSWAINGGGAAAAQAIMRRAAVSPTNRRALLVDVQKLLEARCA